MRHDVIKLIEGPNGLCDDSATARLAGTPSIPSRFEASLTISYSTGWVFHGRFTTGNLTER